MNDVLSFAWLHEAITWLLAPALATLLLACAIALIEAGIAVGERDYGLARLKASGDQLRQAFAHARTEVEQIGPVVGAVVEEWEDCP